MSFSRAIINQVNCLVKSLLGNGRKEGFITFDKI